ncbi:MAG: hypothetical protein M3362_01735 [Acidobacteriota bacterium]|nr:hypothetical protein [Acidobacteriota bacterium]
MKNELIIDQTIHGYSDGHRLLAASCQLSPTSERVLLELSDLSGDIANGFDSYLTGYPLPESNYYALAKTWYAYEMDRPGCVWTHTLLIKRPDFKSFVNIHPLRTYFTRPQKGKSFSAYKNSLIYNENSQGETSFIFPDMASTSIDLKTLYTIVFKNLYEQVKNIVITSENSTQLEDFILSLWCQQWPSLRSRFSFSTGSLAARTVQGRTFALQVAPHQNISFFHNVVKLALIDTIHEQIKPAKIQYAENYRTFRDAQDPLIRFVWFYGSQISPLRKNFGWLAKFYSLINEVRNKRFKITKITDYLAAKFPLPEHMEILKAGLYGGVTSTESHVKPLSDELTLLKELFRTEHADIFNIESLNIFNRVTRLIESSPSAAVKIAKTFNTNMGLNAIRHDYFRALANHLVPNEAITLFHDNQGLLLLLVNFNPQLAATSEIWRADKQVSDQAFQILFNSIMERNKAGHNIADWQPLVFSMLDANVNPLPLELEETLGSQLIKLILDWHAKQATCEPLKKTWEHYLTKDVKEVMRWAYDTNDSVCTKAHIIKILSPNSPEVLTYGSYPWLEMAREPPVTLSRAELNQVMGFLLALGFKNIDRDAPALVAASFQIVYDAALYGSLPRYIWSDLERLAPSNALIFEWDKCRRLEEALVSKAIDYKWDDDLLLKAANKPETFWMVAKRADGSSPGRKLLQRLYKKVSKGIIPATIEQENVLRHFGKVKKE